ncbi:MAG TPA: response regulator [Saprospiraceae bacterium]|nr:response regulator [Saprospiraceae bacterium]
MDIFKRNLIAGYGLSIMLLIVSAVASYISITNLLDSARLVNHTNDVTYKIENVLSILKDAETGQRGFLLTGQEMFLDPYNGAYVKAMSSIEEVKDLTGDNPVQQENCNQLKNITQKRFNFLTSAINLKRSGGDVPDSLLIAGSAHMKTARKLIESMKQEENRLLDIRTGKLNQFTRSTPILILLASLLAIIITIISVVRVMNDYDRRTALQRALQEKDKEISTRLNIIEGIAQQISSGNYKIRVEDAGEDALGGIAESLNSMAASLDTSFSKLSDREWLQTGLATLNENVIVELDITSLAASVLNYVVEYTGSQAGAVYILDKHDELSLKSSYALDPEYRKEKIKRGEGLAGQSALSAKTLVVRDVAESDYTLSFLTGHIKPKTLIAIPLVFNRELKGVIELATINEYSSNKRAFLEAAAINIGIAVNTALNRQRVQELLEETQAQTEELQAQQGELENINSELETQAEKLQASEEELKVQQEELQQANQELEERSRLLEEKNEMILERNLEIQRKADDLAQSTRYKSEFLANMSHELRTPLNSILLLSRLLSENHEHNLSDEQIEYAQVIQNSGKGLLTLIDEILDLTKIESGKMELEYSSVHLEIVTSELESLFAPLAKDKGIGFSVSIDPDMQRNIETDRLRLDQILRNLISNALKFTKYGSVNLDISQKGHAVSFAVRDTGIGIAREKHETIFEAFQQADGSTRRQFGGTGLGLSISRELSKLLGGEIHLESEEGKGSTFTLVIPDKKGLVIAPSATVTNVYTVPAVVPPESRQSEEDDRYISNIIPLPVDDDRGSIIAGDKVVLIVEDDTAFARSLLDYTRQKGYKGIIAVRGDEALELAKRFLPIGILLDIQLPIKSGWQVMDELKANAATRPIPVHMMSSYEVRTKVLSKGAVDFINKPVAFEKLAQMFSKIEEALSKHPKKVMIVEENAKHAQALAYFLQQYNVVSEIKNSVSDGIEALQTKEIDCVILDMGIPEQRSYDPLEEVKKTPGLEDIPIIIFTGKYLSQAEEVKIRQYADTIVIKTAHSYQRILDEVSLFLHLVEENKKDTKSARYKRMGELEEVLKGKTILVADDDVRNIFSLTKSLENYGINVLSAIDGKEALQQLQEHKKIDLVLMDMMMPEMDGYESTRRIRAIHKFKNLPIIAVTAKAMAGDRVKCIEAGASDYITKPVDVDQLISLLRVWLYQ